MDEQITKPTCQFPGCGNKPMPMAVFCKDHRSEQTKFVNAQAIPGREAQKERREELSETHAATIARVREAKAQAKAEAFDCPVACKKDEAKDILRDFRKLTQGYVVNAAYELGELAAKKLRLVSNVFFWRYGVLSAIESLKAKEAKYLLPSVEDEKADGEVFHHQDALALWDYSVSWRPQPKQKGFWKEGHLIGFEEYRELRHLKANPIKMGNRLLDRDFHPEPHGLWQEFLPRPDINALPENYGQEDMKQVLGTLHEFPMFMLLAARNAYKSAFTNVLMLAFIATYYDLRITVASATSALAKDFIKALRKKFLVEHDLTLFQQIFPELVLWDEDGSVLTYENPCARLQLPQPCVSGVGLDVQVAGRRTDWLLCDDILDNTNSDTPELRASTQRKLELLIETVEPTGWTTFCGTPYAQGDAYEVALQRNDANTEKSLAFRIDPVFTITDEEQRRAVLENPALLYQVKEEDVRLLFPSRLTWKFVKAKLQNTELRQFLQQQLLIFTEDGEGNIRLNFELENLQKNVIMPHEIPPSTPDTQFVLSVDRAHSTTRYADRSSISVSKFYENVAGHSAMCVLFNDADRWPTSELGVKIVETAIEYKINLAVIEQDPAWRDLAAVIEIESQKRGVELPIFWKPVVFTRNAKVLRFKSLEGLLNTGRLKFVSGPWIEALFGEMIWQDGIRKSSGSAKDDRVDSISQAALVLPGLAKNKESEATQEARDCAEAQMRMRQQHSLIFGSESPYFDWRKPPQTEEIEPPTSSQDSPIHRALQPLNKGPQKPTLGFGFMSRRPVPGRDN